VKQFARLLWFFFVSDEKKDVSLKMIKTIGLQKKRGKQRKKTEEPP